MFKHELKLCIHKIQEENFNPVCTFAQLCANVLTCAFKITLSAEVGLSGSDDLESRNLQTYITFFHVLAAPSSHFESMRRRSLSLHIAIDGNNVNASN